MIKGTSHEWTVEDADLQIGDDRFWNVDVEVLIEQEAGRIGIVAKDFSGTFSFTHPVPESLFFGEDRIPKKLDAVATSETDDGEKVTVEINGFLVCTGVDGRTVEFVAHDADLTVETEEEPTIEERAVRLLDDLACDIVDDETNVMSVSVSRDPQKRRFGIGWNPGPTTLEIVYDDE